MAGDTTIVQTWRGIIGPIDSVYAIPDTNHENPSIGDPVEYEPPNFSYIDVTATIDPEILEFVDSAMESYFVIEIDLDSFSNYLRNSVYFSRFYLNSPLGNFLLEMQENELRAPGYELVRHLDDTTYMISMDSVDTIAGHYKGFADDVMENIVRMSVTNDLFIGYIHDTLTGTWVQYISLWALVNHYTDASAYSIDKNLIVVYDLANIKLTGGICGIGTHDPHDPDPGDPLDPCLPLTLQIATDADFEFFQIWGNLSNFMINLNLNLVEGVYSAYFNLRFSVTWQEVWETPNQPYVATNLDIIEDNLRNHWNDNRENVERDLVHLWTGKQITEPGSVIFGAAYLGVICVNQGISYSFTSIRDVNNNLRILNHPTTAHEIGHNFSADHEHGENCAPNETYKSIMCQGPVKDFRFSTGAKEHIREYIHENRACLELPSDTNVTGPWLKTWKNDFNKRKIGTWNFNIDDQVFVGDFNGNGKEELLFIAANNNWASIIQYLCGHGNDWYHLWSNMGSGKIDTWIMRAGDRYYVGDFTGNGRTDLLVISGNNRWASLFRYHDGAFEYIWGNGGNRWIGSWYINSFDKFITGDFRGNGRDDLLCMAGSGTWSSILKFSGGTFQYHWGNNVNGTVAGRTINVNNHFISGDFRNLGNDQLYIVGQNNNWVSLHRFDDNTGSWVWSWDNGGSNQFAGWDLPLYYCDYFIVGDLDNDGKEEILFVHNRERNNNWVQSKDIQNNVILTTNWHNSGSGNFAFWDMNCPDNNCNYFTLKPHPYYPKQVLMIKSTKVNRWWQSTAYRYDISKYRSSLQINFKKDPNTSTVMEYDDLPRQIIVYPNPTGNEIFVSLYLDERKYDNSNNSNVLSVLDITGRKVLNTYNVDVNKKINLNIGELKPGIYIIKYRDAEIQITEKLIIN